MGGGPAAWSLISISSGRQYQGNEGYDDVEGQSYSYDSRVPNHKQLAAGDLVVLRSAADVLGAAQVQRVEVSEGSRTENRCPSCGSTKLNKRRVALPPWRCQACHSSFGQPVQRQIAVTTYRAVYGDTFVGAPGGVPAGILKAAAIKPNDQMAIERLDPAQLRRSLGPLFPDVLQLFAMVEATRTLDARESEPPAAQAEPNGGSLVEQPTARFVPSVADTREAVLRSIRARRGQQAFRNSLVRRYGPECMLTGCRLMDVVEAAHIVPYRGDAEHHEGNGLLLRADVHTLFDLFLLSFHPDSFACVMIPDAAAAGYGALQGRVLHSARGAMPDREAIRRHHDAFELRMSRAAHLQRAHAVTA